MRWMMLAALAAGSLTAQNDKAVFEVASVRPSAIAKAGREGSGRENIQAELGSVTMRNVSLSSSIQWVYGVRPYQVSGPGWLREERYDISAKAEGRAKLEQLEGKNGNKLHPSEGEAEPAFNGGKLNLKASRMPLSRLTEMLAGVMQAPVIDMTGLSGRFDFTLDLSSYRRPTYGTGNRAIRRRIWLRL